MKHTTHFADCGCLAEQHAAEIAKALVERNAAMRENLYYEKKIAWLEVEVKRLRGALQDCMRQSILPCPCVRIAHEALAGKEAEG